MKNKIFFVFLLALILVPSVYSLGVTPGRNTVDFSSNLEKEISFTILNTQKKDMDVAFRVEGDLKDYIIVDKEIVSFEYGDSSREFSYLVRLPKGLSPGLHKANIITTEIPKSVSESGTVVKATVSVITQLYVYVPYPGKYIEARVDTNYDESKNVVDFYIPFISRGEEDIGKISSVIEIYDGDQKIDEVKTNELSAKSGDKKELTAFWEPSEEKGKYLAKVFLDYDGKKINLEKEFLFGPKEIDLLSIGVNNFKLGDVAKINILVQNNLPKKISGVFANLKIYDESLDQIDNLRSFDYEIESDSNEEIVVYWDTESISRGNYGSELKVDYEDKFLERSFEVEVLEDSISFNGIGFVVSNGGGPVNIVTILLIVIGFLVLVNLVWLVWWMGQKSIKEKEKEDI